MKILLVTSSILLGTVTAFGQTLFIPGGTGSSTTGNVGIGTSTPGTLLDVVGGAIRGDHGIVSRLTSAGGLFVGYGAGLDGSTYQLFALYADTTNGLYFDAPRDSANNRLNVQFNWRGGGTPSLFIQGSTGYVGIGTANPAYNLDVRSAGDAQIAALETSSGNSTRAILGANANEAYVQELYHSYAKPLTFKINGEMMRLDVTGNLGIGTTTPSMRLEVNGSASGLPATSGTNQATGSLRVSNAQTGGVLDVGVAGGAMAAAWLQYTNRSDLSQTYALLLNPNGGNVGIGTTNPTQKLSVNGTIQAKEVIVQTGWSDYVFKPGYRLASLSEVEGAIKRDGHLPGVPSAAEVAKQGVSVGQMEATLLAKLEEVTLHLIRLEKENADLRARVHALETKSSP